MCGGGVGGGWFGLGEGGAQVGSSWHSEDRGSQGKFIHHGGAATAHVMTGNDPAGEMQEGAPWGVFPGRAALPLLGPKDHSPFSAHCVPRGLLAWLSQRQVSRLLEVSCTLESYDWQRSQCREESEQGQLAPTASETGWVWLGPGGGDCLADSAVWA